MTKNEKALMRAADRIARVANVVEPLGLADETPLRDVAPGAWPTLGDVIALRDAMIKAGWDFDNQR